MRNGVQPRKTRNDLPRNETTRRAARKQNNGNERIVAMWALGGVRLTQNVILRNATRIAIVAYCCICGDATPTATACCQQNWFLRSWWMTSEAENSGELLIVPLWRRAGIRQRKVVVYAARKCLETISLPTGWLRVGTVKGAQDSCSTVFIVKICLKRSGFWSIRLLEYNDGPGCTLEPKATSWIFTYFCLPTFRPSLHSCKVNLLFSHSSPAH
jgi:hypothetical protein